MFFDSHAHYDSSQFNDDRAQLIEDIHAAGVDLVCNVGCDLSSSMKSVALAEKYDWFYAAVGTHPSDTGKMTDTDLTMYESLSRHPKVVAIGEIGLDYYWDETPRDVQQLRFRQQLDLAKELKMPVIIHEREAHEDAMKIVREYAGAVTGVFHCFSGAVEMAKELVKMGWYIGMTGVVTYKNARKSVEVVQWVPEDRLLIETDCPYLTPVPNRGKRNDSRNLAFTAAKIAEIRGITPEQAAKMTMDNAKRFYGIK